MIFQGIVHMLSLYESIDIVRQGRLYLWTKLFLERRPFEAAKGAEGVFDFHIRRGITVAISF
jgi:hypothetical protein